MKKARTVKISKFLILVVVFLFIIIIARLSYVVLSKNVDGIDLKEFASNRNTVKETITAKRGAIYDSLGNVLAINVNSYTVIAILSDRWTTDMEHPNHVVDKERTAKELSPLLNMSYETLLDLLYTEDVYQVELGPGGKGITELQKEQIEKLNLPGIDFMKGVKRYYPNGDFLSYTIGYAKTDEFGKVIGEMGLELEFDDELTGTDGFREYESDVYGYKIANTNENVTKAMDGKDVYLTIDTNIQMFAEQAITKMEQSGYLDWGVVSVVEAKTGKILAVASTPSFDPNTKEISDYYNHFISYPYEPGSTMKTFSFMAAMDYGIYDGNEIYSSGYIDIDKYRIRDWNIWGWGNITLDQGYIASSNVAATILSQRLGKDKLKEFYTRLGLGTPTGIDLPGEESGSLNFNYDIEVANASFGQGMTITPVQMVQMLTTITNDGVMLKPYIVDKIVDPTTGEIVKQNKRTEVRRITKKEITDRIKEMMWGVVNSDEIMASGTRFRTDIVTTIGKTGTAEIASPDGGYYTGSRDYVRSFAGIFPYEDPQIIIYVVDSRIADSDYETMAVKTLIEDVSTYLGFVSSPKEKENDTYIMNSYINKNATDVKNELEGKNLNVIVIGNGDKIIKQYPIANTELNVNDKVFLLTNGDKITYTNMNSWAFTDLERYAKILGVNFIYNGSGYATDANFENREVIKGETIEINLSKKYT